MAVVDWHSKCCKTYLMHSCLPPSSLCWLCQALVFCLGRIYNCGFIKHAGHYGRFGMRR